MSAQAQSPADLQKEIELLKGQLKVLSEKIEAMSAAQAEPAAITQQVTRLEQKMDLAEDDAVKSGLKGLKFKGTMEIAYLNDSTSTKAGFDKTTGNGGYGAAMLELNKEPDAGIGWTLRLIPLSSGSIVHEASVAVPMGDSGTKLIAGLTPDWSGYEYSMGHQNPLITNNLLYANAASNYSGVGASFDLGGGFTGKWMVGQVDGALSRKSPGLAYRGDYSISEYSGLGFSGIHTRTSDANLNPGTNADLMEVDGYYTRGDWSLQGQFSFGKAMGAAIGVPGEDAKWWGLSGFAGYKVTPRMQVIGRLDYVNNRSNGGGAYYNPADASGNFVYGPERESDGVTITDPSVGANRYALSLGTNYAINANTAWKTEVRLDRSSGYNFLDADGAYKKNKSTLGTSIVVSF
jgi:hypothetical protein